MDVGLEKINTVFSLILGEHEKLKTNPGLTDRGIFRSSYPTGMTN